MLPVWCVGAISRVTQLPCRTSGNIKKPVEYSFIADSTRRAFLSDWTEKNIRYVPFFLCGRHCCAPSWWLYPWFFEVKAQVLETRTGYLSGYISSSALNVCVSVRNCLQVVKHSRGAVHHALFICCKGHFHELQVLFDLHTQPILDPLLVDCVLHITGQGPKEWL